MCNNNFKKENEESQNFVTGFYSEFSKAAKESPSLYFAPLKYCFTKLRNLFTKK